ncbi:MAG TPA: hypothetical protein VD835_01135 [Pyrinomonadaceae bacterium]|nr:hypothetical protein [Pyrinomonadaceae bacterium]
MEMNPAQGRIASPQTFDAELKYCLRWGGHLNGLTVQGEHDNTLLEVCVNTFFRRTRIVANPSGESARESAVALGVVRAAALSLCYALASSVN